MEKELFKNESRPGGYEGKIKNKMVNKMKKNNYYVIGGQYQHYCYGSVPTLLGAKRLAKKRIEYWDNWQGFHVPSVYKAEDVVECENAYGVTFVPKYGSSPVASASCNGGLVVWEGVRV